LLLCAESNREYSGEFEVYAKRSCELIRFEVK
jgi:hypothetical protein